MNLLHNFHLAVIEYLYIIGLQQAHWWITGRSRTSFIQLVLICPWWYWTNTMEL